jgi:hypothetical protein
MKHENQPLTWWEQTLKFIVDRPFWLLLVIITLTLKMCVYA